MTEQSRLLRVSTIERSDVHNDHVVSAAQESNDVGQQRARHNISQSGDSAPGKDIQPRCGLDVPRHQGVIDPPELGLVRQVDQRSILGKIKLDCYCSEVGIRINQNHALSKSVDRDGQVDTHEGAPWRTGGSGHSNRATKFDRIRLLSVTFIDAMSLALSTSLEWRNHLR
ncbi:MAG: hypothetical protein WBA31_04190 [Candidatus Dormiibacterota bacterium]